MSYLNKSSDWFCHCSCGRPILCHLEHRTLALVNWKFRGCNTVNVPKLLHCTQVLLFHYWISSDKCLACSKCKTAQSSSQTKITAHPSHDQNIFCNRAGRDNYFTNCILWYIVSQLVILFYMGVVMKQMSVVQNWKMSVHKSCLTCMFEFQISF
jgi:hypothetical protein